MPRSSSKAILTLLLLLVVGRTWAADAGEGDAAPAPDAEDANMQSWQETWQDDREERGWTWFGMGYESRRAASGSTGGTHSGGPAKGQGGSGGNGNGGGKRR